MAWRGSATTIGTSMSPRAPKSRRRWLRWLVPGTFVVLAPKCALCLAAYFGLGTAFGVTGVELCGAAAETPAHLWPWLLLASVAAGVCVVYVRHSRATKTRRSERAREIPTPSGVA